MARSRTERMPDDTHALLRESEKLAAVRNSIRNNVAYPNYIGRKCQLKILHLVVAVVNRTTS